MFKWFKKEYDDYSDERLKNGIKQNYDLLDKQQEFMDGIRDFRKWYDGFNGVPPTDIYNIYRGIWNSNVEKSRGIVRKIEKMEAELERRNDKKELKDDKRKENA